MRRRPIDLLVAGLLWGLLASLLGRRAFPQGLWGGVVAAPLIGLLVGRWFQPGFEARRGVGRSLTALVTLYVGAALFAIGVAVGNWERFRAVPLAAVGETILSVWWGMTFTGFLLFLWPLGYLTHWLIEWRDGGAG